LRLKLIRVKKIPEIIVIVEINITNLCTLGKREENIPFLFTGLNIKTTKKVIPHHSISERK
jgi:hypothetical protein